MMWVIPCSSSFSRDSAAARLWLLESLGREREGGDLLSKEKVGIDLVDGGVVVMAGCARAGVDCSDGRHYCGGERRR